MRNEKLVPMTLPDPRERTPYLPQPNGDNKLTAAMVPYYTGNTNTLLFLHTLKNFINTKESLLLIPCLCLRSVLLIRHCFYKPLF